MAGLVVGFPVGWNLYDVVEPGLPGGWFPWEMTAFLFFRMWIPMVFILAGVIYGGCLLSKIENGGDDAQ